MSDKSASQAVVDHLLQEHTRLSDRFMELTELRDTFLPTVVAERLAVLEHTLFQIVSDLLVTKKG